MTRKEAIKKHRELWHWLAEETRKRQYCVRKKENPGVECKEPRNACWLCEYALRYNKYEKRWFVNCIECPIDWGKGCRDCEDDGSLYREWKKALVDCNVESYADMADRIAELPEKGVK